MSDENDQKPDEFDFDMNALGPEGGTGNIADEDFNPFADDAFAPAPAMSDDQTIPIAGTAEEAENLELPTGATDAGDFDFTAFTDEGAEASPPAETGPEDLPAEETEEAAPADTLDDLPVPSSFLTGETEPAESAEPTEDVAVPVVEDGKKSKKKDKKEKKKKEKKEKKPKAEKKKKEPKEKGEPLELGAVFSLALAVVLLVGLIAVNVWTVLAPPAGVGLMSTVCYLVGIDVFGLCGILAPVLFYVYRKDIDVFKVSLGLSVMALCLGTIFLMTPLYHYDFDFKAGSTPSSRPAPSAPAPETPAPEAPAPEAPAPETPATTDATGAEDIFGEQ